MPELDPAWEYWVPDEEIAEVLAERSRGGYCLITDRRLRKEDNEGLRFGQGNPDRFSFRLARERPEREARAPAWRYCKGCGHAFRPRRASHRYCHISCFPRRGRQRRVADRQCRQCGIVFRPREAARAYCSMACVAQSQVKATPVIAGGCAWCGGPIPPSESRNKAASRRFCKRSCKNLMANHNRRKRQREERRCRPELVGPGGSRSAAEQ